MSRLDETAAKLMIDAWIVGAALASFGILMVVLFLFDSLFYGALAVFFAGNSVLYVVRAIQIYKSTGDTTRPPSPDS